MSASPVSTSASTTPLGFEQLDLGYDRKDALFAETPCVPSFLSTSADGPKLFLKLDNLQPSGSFKDRGLGHLIRRSLLENPKIDKFIASSAGNAGYSTALMGKRLSIPVEIFCPVTTVPLMVDKLRALGAKVTVAGANWNEADVFAHEALEKEANALYVHPFEHPLIWEGHSTLVEELYHSFHGVAPDAIVLCVGGGGMLAGVQRGLARVGWTSTRVIAVETEGAGSYAAAAKAGRPVRIEKISTICATLGALQVCEGLFPSPVEVTSVLVSDRDAVEACLLYAQRERQLVEASCGASLSIVLLDKHRHLLDGCRTVVAIVCGGNSTGIDLLAKYRADFGL